MTIEFILVTLLASLLSGLVGVLVSFYFFQRLERRKLKFDTAKKLFGSKHNMAGKEFQEAMNEIMVVFSDSNDVIVAMDDLWTTLQTPLGARGPNIANEKMVKLMKAVCRAIGVKYKNLPDTYYLRYLTVPNNIPASNSIQR